MTQNLENIKRHLCPQELHKLCKYVERSAGYWWRRENELDQY